VQLTGPWKNPRIAHHLDETVIPLRLACTSDAGWPVVVSLWYLYRDGVIWCATQRSSHVARVLAANPKCAFEVAGETPPYFGVRGQGTARLEPERGADVLESLIDRYLTDDNADLARWLRGRIETETAIAIEPVRMRSWDYSHRMVEG
jgi:nitroimidazol reductase NimA-like FMN-containing flavoprotein (pyridoxamine 5'-phosphate oxidase superfamily)